MEATRDDIEVRKSVNDSNEGLRRRLSGLALPDPRPEVAELQLLVIERLDPGLLHLDEEASRA
jgi:hypothetical protein